jgi:hypothetical protein
MRKIKIGRDWVLELLEKAYPRSRTCLQMAADSGRTRNTINSATFELARKGLIERVSPGTFKWKPNHRCEEIETKEPPFEAGQPNDSPEADRPANVPALCVADLEPVDDEMRVRDIRLAETAQMGQPRNIRAVIKKNETDLRRYGVLHVRNAEVVTSHGARHQVQEYWLNEGQAVRLLTLLKTEFANEATYTVIGVFLAYRHGKLQPTDNSALMGVLERMDATRRDDAERAERHHCELMRFMAEANKQMAGMLMTVRETVPLAPAMADNVRTLAPAIFDGLMFDLRKAPRHTVKRQNAAARRLADLMCVPGGEGGFTRQKLAKALVWMKAVTSFEKRYHEGDLVTVPVIASPDYANWFVMTIDEINERHVWTWALTDEAMLHLEWMAPEIKDWFERAA